MGRLTSARASATRWRCPPESCCGLRVAKPVIRIISMTSSTREAISAAGTFFMRRPKATLSLHRQVREQRVGLEHGVDRAQVARESRSRRCRRCGSGRSRAGRAPRSCAARWSCRSPRDRAWRRTRLRGSSRSRGRAPRCSPKRRVTSATSTAAPLPGAPARAVSLPGFAIVGPAFARRIARPDRPRLRSDASTSDTCPPLPPGEGLGVRVRVLRSLRPIPDPIRPCVQVAPMGTGMTRLVQARVAPQHGPFPAPHHGASGTILSTMWNRMPSLHRHASGPLRCPQPPP